MVVLDSEHVSLLCGVALRRLMAGLGLGHPYLEGKVAKVLNSMPGTWWFH